MRPREAAGLPALRVEMVTPERLAASWSGAGARRAWRGRLGDGSELTIERGPAGDLRIANQSCAAFRLDPTRSRLECAPREPDGIAWKRLLLGRVLPLASLAHGYEALHASAVLSPRGVVAIAAPSGAGKSTLAAELTARGWPHFTDDVLVLEAGPDGPLAHPGTPHANLSAEGTGPDPHALGEILDVRGGESWTAISAAALAPGKVAAVFTLDRRPGQTAKASPLPASPLTLAPYMLGLPDQPGGEDRRFSTYSDLAGSVPFLELLADPDAGPAELADAVEAALAPQPTLAGAAAS